MKKRAFTLAEVLVVVVFLGLITAGLFPFLAYELRNINRSFAFSQDAFELQTEVEHAVVDLNERVEGKDVDTISDKDWGEWKKLRIKMFSGKETNLVARTVSTKGKDIDTANPYNRNAVIILPQKRFEGPKVPKITVTLKQDTANSKQYLGKVEYKDNKDKPGVSERDDVNFCVYRWYLGNSLDKDGNKIPPSKLVLIREYNEVKEGGKERLFEKTKFQSLVKQDPTKSEDILVGSETVHLDYYYPVAYIDGLAPLVAGGVEKDKNKKKDGDKFRIDNLNMNTDSTTKLTEQEMERFYNHKSLVFSCMVVTNEGVLGEEVFSEPVDLNYKLEDFMFGQSSVKVDDGKGNYRTRFYFKQINNLVKNREYTFFFYHKGHGTRYYLKNDPAEPNSYTVVSGHNQGVKLRVDDYGNAAFQVYLPKGFDFGYVFQNERGEDILTGFVK